MGFTERRRRQLVQIVPDPPRVELYRPSNGTEGEWFVEHFCENCERERQWREEEINPCEILGATFMFDVDDEGYPTEWRYVEGKPTCTAFVPLGAQYPTTAMLEAMGQIPLLEPPPVA